MTIAIDIDNVIQGTTIAVLDYINERLPDVNLKMEDITSYWIENFVPEQYKWIVPLSFTDSSMWKNVRLIDGAARYIEKLYEEGFEIYFATATTPVNLKKKIKFLKRNLNLPNDYIADHMISIKNKQLLRVDIMIDDFLGNLTGDRTYLSICYDYPWNQTDNNRELDSQIIRCEDWADIYDTILKYARYS